jgi:GT2 family glycosyltransferase/glycosyltransferase involved in cell wall biosynthesis
MNSVSIIIPVYNAFADTLDCLESVQRNLVDPTLASDSDPRVRVIVIDDASPQGLLSEHIPETLKSDARFYWFRNERNLGFTGTCNRGMLVLAGSDDVVLLNSDTVVTPRWLSKMQAAAYHKPDIGTVTALTNNGIIASVPEFCRDNALPRDFTADEFAALVEHVSRRRYPALPTCVGFCVYIPRAVIDSIGGLDERAFPVGYGEENDFSCRAQRAGFTDILDDATFIFHKGGMSFGESQHALRAAHGAVLAERHPTYMSSVQRFCQTNPLRAVHAEIWKGLITRDSCVPHPVVLHVLQNGPFEARRHEIGGTEQHVLDLARGVHEAHHWTLSPGLGTPGHTTLYLSYVRGSSALHFELPPGSVGLSQLISPEFFDLVHVHHAMGYNRSALVESVRSHGTYLASLHDFFWVCPRAFRLTPTLRECTLKECHKECAESPQGLAAFRDSAARFFEGATRIIGFSQSTFDLYGDILPRDERLVRIPHGIAVGSAASVEGASAPPPSESRPLKVLLYGTLAAHKGLRLLREAIAASHTQSLPLEWHLLGVSHEPLPPHVHNHGQYQRDESLARLRAIAPDVVVLASLAPETFSLTLSEAWIAGIPVVATPSGALKERITESGAGRVISETTAHALLDALMSLQRSPKELITLKSLAERAHVPTLFDECRAYGSLYHKVAKPNKGAPMLSLLELLGRSAVNSSTWQGGSLGRALRPDTILERSLQWGARNLTPRALYERIRERRLALENQLSGSAYK